MTTLKFRPLLRTAAAAAAILVGSVPALPAWAGPGDPSAAQAPAAADASPAPEPAGATPVDMSTAAASPASVISDAGLAEAVSRDLGLTLAEFNAAGAVARRAADAAPALRELPGYLGISLSGGRIAVDGAGGALQARIDELNEDGPASFFLRAPQRTSTARPAAPADVADASAPAATHAGADAGGEGVPAAEAAPLLALSVEQLFQAYIREVGSAGLQAVTYAGGHFVIRAGGSTVIETGLPAADLPAADPAQPQPAASGQAQRVTPADFVARYANVALEEGSPIATEDDFFGGQGYIIDGRTVCSAGFGAYNAVGEPVLLTAGHCTEDGAARKADVELASAAPAGTPPGGTPGSGTAAGTLGTFGFSQFGGPGNTTATADGGAAGTDIAVLEGISSGVRLQPAVTRWDDPNNPGPSAVKIVGTLTPFQGLPVCRSGRTLGWSCGTVDSVGIFTVGGRNNFPDGADLRALHGFDSTTVQSRPGDSGGPWISGNFAVGTHTGAETEGGQQLRAVAATLTDAVDRIPGGIQLQVFLNKPELELPAAGTVAAGEAVSGRVPAAPASAVPAQSRVRISIRGHAPFEVPVDAAGGFSFAAPAATGPRQVSAETVNGFSHSGETVAILTVTAQPAPPVTAPGPVPAVEGLAAAARAEEPAAVADPAPARPQAPVPAGPGPAGTVAVQPAAAGQASAESGAIPVPIPAPTAPASAPAPAVTAQTDPADAGQEHGTRADMTPAGLPGLAMLALAAGGAALLGVVLLILSRRRVQH